MSKASPKNTAANAMPGAGSHIAYRHVGALLNVWHAARALMVSREGGKPYNNEALRWKAVQESEASTPEEKRLAQMLAEPVLGEGKEGKLLALIVMLLDFVVPGADIPASKFAIAKLVDDVDAKHIALMLEISPGKNVRIVMNKENALHFEKSFAEAFTQHFGRITLN